MRFEHLNCIKLLVTDIDGTLIGSDHTIGERTFKMLKKLKEKGVYLALATGRPYTALPASVIESGLFDYCIACNGTCIVHLSDDQLIYRRVLTQQQAKQLADLFALYPYPLEVVVDGCSHVPAIYYNDPLQYALPERMVGYVKRTRIPEPDIRVFIQNHIDNIESFNLVIDDLSVKAEILNHLKAFPSVYVTCSSPYYIECNPQDAHKGHALRGLCDYLNIDIQETIAFGDSDNDIELLEAAGMAVAMAGACEKLKDIADLVTADCDEEGLAEVLEELSDMTNDEKTIYQFHIEDEGVVIQGFCESAADTAYAQIPDIIKGLPVVRIAEKAFYECRTLKGMTLPDSVKCIEKYAFAECRSLEHIQMSDGIDTMGDYAFYNCHALKMVSIPGNMKSLGYGVFKNCSKMEDITLYIDESQELEVSALFEDSSHEIRITLCDMAHQILTKLILTEFDYDCILQVEARQFDWVYHGSGNVFRQCITKKGVDYKKYDGLFHMAVREDSLSTAIQIATDRIIYPHKLMDEHKSVYAAFLQEHRNDVFEYYLKNQDIEGFEIILTYICDENSLNDWIDLSGERQVMNFLSFLMDYRNKRYGKKKKSFDL